MERNSYIQKMACASVKRAYVAVAYAAIAEEKAELTFAMMAEAEGFNWVYAVNMMNWGLNKLDKRWHTGAFSSKIFSNVYQKKSQIFWSGYRKITPTVLLPASSLRSSLTRVSVPGKSVLNSSILASWATRSFRVVIISVCNCSTSSKTASPSVTSKGPVAWIGPWN